MVGARAGGQPLGDLRNASRIGHRGGRSKEMWNDQRLLHLLEIEHPILQAPMAGSTTRELVAAVNGAGRLGASAPLARRQVV